MSGDGNAGGGGRGNDGAVGVGVDIDAVTLEILRNQLESVAEEMGRVLVTGSYSPNIKERRDCSTALFDAEGRVVAQAEHIPVHLGAMPEAVAAVRERDPRPGDVFALNDPFEGGTHLPDVTLVSPLAPRGEVVGYAVSRAHHADIGGSTPGSMPAGAREIYEEGLRIPPVRLVAGGGDDPAGTAGAVSTADPADTVGASEGGGAAGTAGSAGDGPSGAARAVNEDVMSLLLANVRTPDERRADLRAQIAANDRADERLGDLFDEHGDFVPAAFDAVIDYSRERITAEIEALPDGTYAATDALEGDGVLEHRPGVDPADVSVPVEVTVTVDGGRIHVDFAGTAEQAPGNLNAPLSVAKAAVYFVVRCVTDPEIPPNQGCYDPVTVEAPEGSLLDPTPPAAVGGGNVETSQRVTDVVLAAFAEAVPDRVPAAGQGTMNNLVVGSRADPFTYYETIGGGFGARHSKDGMDGVQVGMTNTLNTPVEALEAAYPLRVERYRLRPNSGGDGRYRGGLGLERSLTIDAEATVSLLTERRRVAPPGLAGGGDGAVGRNLVGGDPVAAKTSVDVDAGATVTVLTPGGGGYGDPTERDREARERDRADGKVTDGG